MEAEEVAPPVVVHQYNLDTEEIFKTKSKEIGHTFKVTCKIKNKGELSVRSATFVTFLTPNYNERQNYLYSFKCECGKVFDSKHGMGLKKLISLCDCRRLFNNFG